MSLHEHVGRVVDERYILNQRVGSGATGAVYRATQKVVDREVAVKLLSRNATDDPNYRSRFEREAKVLGLLDHAGFVRVFDFGWYAELNQPYLVTEFVEGLPLCDVTDELTPRQFLNVVAKVCAALQHAHEKGIAHRDLKPANILIPYDHDTEGTKVVDFGLAAILDNESIRVTQKGDAFGTPAYMSPEQCVGDEEIGPATDVYSLGCWMFEYFEGALPFTGSTASRVMIKHVTRPVPKLSDDALPKPLKQLIAQMMEKSPDDRPTMIEIGEQVAKLLRAGRASWLTMPRVAKPAPSEVDPTIRTTRPVPYVERTRYIEEQFPESSLSTEATTVAFDDDEDAEASSAEDEPLASMESGFLEEGFATDGEQPDHLRTSFFETVSTRRVPVALAMLAAAVGIGVVAWMMLRGDSALATAAPQRQVEQHVAPSVLDNTPTAHAAHAEQQRASAGQVARAIDAAQVSVTHSVAAQNIAAATSAAAASQPAVNTNKRAVNTNKRAVKQAPKPTAKSTAKPPNKADKAAVGTDTASQKSRPSAKLRY